MAVLAGWRILGSSVDHDEERMTEQVMVDAAREAMEHIASNSREDFINVVALMLDYPSVYIGGPSKINRSKGERIYKGLVREGFVILKSEG